MTKKLLIILLASLMFLFFLVKDINLPYVGPNATNFNVYSLIAHNFNKFGYVQTKLAPIISITDKYPANPHYFFHHPTLLSFSESLLFKIFGENFWVGRLTVILYSFGSFIFIYLIAKKLFDEKFAVISLIIASLIPATTIWGKMIGQEPLVLFFALLSLYLLLLYFDTKNKKYFYFSLLSVILGILSDWPAILFPFAILPIFIKNKKKEGAILCFVSIFTTIILLAYVYVLRSGFWDLQNAVVFRSFTGLLSMPYWPITWIEAWIVRLIIYFNPLIVILSAIFLYTQYKLFKSKKLSGKEIVILCLFIFPIFHQLLYAQAVFSHNYLLYYLLPFFVFSSSYVLNNLLKNKRYVLFSSVIIFSLAYLFIISGYKNKQVESNLWRYEFAQKISEFTKQYETVALNNRDNAVNPDLLWYPFLLNMVVSETETAGYYSKNYDRYVFTCNNLCPSNIVLLNEFKDKYKFVHISATQAQAYIIYLKEEKVGDNTKDEINIVLKTSPSKLLDETLAKKIYNYLRTFLNLSQV
ncbi:MAG: hypothetical protein A2171_00360 [Candidatus Levybacteria bacterium RBG_13_35_9]|nr:MAG: hypothetical protein A2171_00360 [Candidatus Levybacteria bacterium RBG_13_35_9]